MPVRTPVLVLNMADVGLQWQSMLNLDMVLVEMSDHTVILTVVAKVIYCFKKCVTLVHNSLCFCDIDHEDDQLMSNCLKQNTEIVKSIDNRHVFKLI